MRVGSKGKGSRRLPGRDGGRGRSRPGTEAWKKRASHAVAEVDLRHPTVKLGYSGKFREPLENAAYRLDQAFALNGIAYSVCVPEGHAFLEVTVSKADGARSKDLVNELWKKHAAT
jgi:hypothetical protein